MKLYYYFIIENLLIVFCAVNSSLANLKIKSISYSATSSNVYNAIFMEPAVFKSLFDVSVDRVKWVGAMTNDNNLIYSVSAYINPNNQYLTVVSDLINTNTYYKCIITIIYE